ncbi:hypothetical protein ABEB36_010503 [Hypothenemus hampei]|uniref:RING-type E3 ubiquitin transferase n=1 Tax=Hypothenemus hampei TaxID=57062 RepID=A0ABD1EK35_HYPHA
MASKNVDHSTEGDNLCVVCFKNVEIYSIGICDHAVCFECSTRMRILCKQNECPICRGELQKVLFTRDLRPYATLYPKFEKSSLQDRNVGIIFCTPDVQRAYLKLLEHRCRICEKANHNWAFKSFNQLKDHMRREHELFYCDICSEHLKIFSFERDCYTRQDLAYHRRKGDKNNTSHRGHPLCEFCDTRFMDNDELFRHLRRNHLFCHICDTDGKHQYYNAMEDLKQHFREEHFLCEEGECKTMLLTAVFKTEIDLKAHIATHHGRNMSKSANRQARTLELEFTMAPRQRSENIRSRKPNDRPERNEDGNSFAAEPGGSNSQSQVFVNPLAFAKFPALGGATVETPSNFTLVSKNYTKFTNAAFSSNDFPSLGGSSNSRQAPAVRITANSAAGTSAPEVTITRTVRNPQPLAQKPKEAFPALGGTASKPSSSSTVRLSVNSNNQQQPAPKVSIQVNQQSNGAITTHITTTSAPSTSQRNTDLFPALSENNDSTQFDVKQPKWVQPRQKKQEPETKKATTSRGVLESGALDLNSFPSLSKDKPKKSSSVTLPVDSWVNLNTLKNSTKGVKGSDNSATKVSVENGAKAGGAVNKNKKVEAAKKTNQKNAKAIAQATSKLSSKLESLKLVSVNSSENSEETKKSKKKKNKNSSENGNNNEMDNNKKEVNDNKNRPDLNHNEITVMKNGFTKKRSELKIDNLIGNESPSVESATKPPPGFSNMGPIKPPPGFNNSSNCSLNICNDLTFTTSRGQSFAISPSNGQPTYKAPQNLQIRNQNLIKRLKEILNDDEKIIEFKSLSDKFRKSDVDVTTYTNHCHRMLGERFDDVIPELLVLLPDIKKQQELYKELRGWSIENMEVCINCHQVVLKRDLDEHFNHHLLENHFPTLGSAQKISSSWKK